MSTHKKPRTVAYFELVDGANGSRMEHQKWTEVLAAFAQAKPDQLQVETTERKLVGKTYTFEDADHLVLGRVRDETAPPANYHFKLGTIEDLQSEVDKGFIEISVVSFLNFGNVIAFMRGPHGSPLIGDLETWLNGIKPLDGIQIAAQPILSTSVPTRLKKAVAVDELRVRALTSASGATKDAHGFRRMLAVAREEYGEVQVEMTIKIRGARKKHPSERQALLNDATVAASAQDVSKASARLAYGEQDGSGAETVDFVRHRVTRKRNVEVVYDDSDTSFEGLRVRSVVREMVAAAALDEAELKAAVDA